MFNFSWDIVTNLLIKKVEFGWLLFGSVFLPIVIGGVVAGYFIILFLSAGTQNTRQAAFNTIILTGISSVIVFFLFDPQPFSSDLTVGRLLTGVPIGIVITAIWTIQKGDEYY